MRGSIKYLKNSLLVSTHPDANLSYECNLGIFECQLPLSWMEVTEWAVHFLGNRTRERKRTLKWFNPSLQFMDEKQRTERSRACPRSQSKSFQLMIQCSRLRQILVHSLVPLVTWDEQMCLGVLTHRRRLIISVLLHCSEDQMRKYMLSIFDTRLLTHQTSAPSPTLVPLPHSMPFHCVWVFQMCRNTLEAIRHFFWKKSGNELHTNDSFFLPCFLLSTVTLPLRPGCD